MKLYMVLGFATIVGEKTGGDGIVGSPLFCALPNSGFIFKFSFTMGLTEDGSCNEEFKTKPDIEITQKWYSNIFADKSIEYILTDKIQDAKVSDILKVALICILIVGVIIYKIWFKIL